MILIFFYSIKNILLSWNLNINNFWGQFRFTTLSHCYFKHFHTWIERLDIWIYLNFCDISLNTFSTFLQWQSASWVWDIVNSNPFFRKSMKCTNQDIMWLLFGFLTGLRNGLQVSHLMKIMLQIKFNDSIDIFFFLSGREDD